MERLDVAFLRAIDHCTSVGGPVGVLFSGGVDSAILAWALRDRPRTTLFTLGTAGATDLGSAESAARIVGLPWQGIPVDGP